MFSAKIIADSINPTSNRITTFLLTYPRFIHSELMTHRAFSRNAASSRAIPIEKMIEAVERSPAMPVRWGSNGKGMQDHGEVDDAGGAEGVWREAALSAVESARWLMKCGLHKQIVNRVLEPFLWMTTLVTVTEFENFFSLRVHKDAQPEFQHLAHMMLHEYVASIPTELDHGEWHVPFGDRMPENAPIELKLKIATARAARTSYLTFDKDHTPENDVDLHDRLASSGHWSPFEHCAQAWAGQFGNFLGWRQYRKNFPNENRDVDLNALLRTYEVSLRSEGREVPE